MNKENAVPRSSPCGSCAVTRRPFQERQLNVAAGEAVSQKISTKLSSVQPSPAISLSPRPEVFHLSPVYDDEAQLEHGQVCEVQSGAGCAGVEHSTRPSFAELRRLSLELQQTTSPGPSSPAFPVPTVSSPTPYSQPRRVSDYSDDAVVAALRTYIAVLSESIDSAAVASAISTIAPPPSPSHPHAPLGHGLWLTDAGCDTLEGGSPEALVDGGEGGVGLLADVEDIEDEEQDEEREGEEVGCTWRETPDRPWIVSGAALLQGSVEAEVTGRCLRKNHVEFFVLVGVSEGNRKGRHPHANGAVSLLCRRFQDFVRLADALQRAAQRDGGAPMGPPALPPRSLVPKWLTDWRDVAFLDKRQSALGAWLKAVMAWQEAAGQTSRDILAEFLSPTY